MLWNEHQAARGNNMRSLSLPNMASILSNEIVDATRRQSAPDLRNELTEEPARKFSNFNILPVSTSTRSSRVNKVP